MNLRSGSSSSRSDSAQSTTSNGGRGIIGNSGVGGREDGAQGALQLRAYIIPEEQEAEEVMQNLGRPNSDFALITNEAVDVQEFKLRELRRRYAAMTEEDIYQAQLLNEFETMKKKMRFEEAAVGTPVGPVRKATSHFTDRDGKCYTSYNRDVTRSTVEYSMPFLRMAHAGRVLEVCADELHVRLEVTHARGVFMNKVNMHSSLLVDHWESLHLWGTVENLAVMQKDKFSHVLLFDGNIEDLKEFSISSFLENPSTLSNLVYLREAMDNMELVYRCVMGEAYVGLCSVAKEFLMNNISILSTRKFDFVRYVFEGAFVHFQLDMRTRDVSTGASPLNTSELVKVFFQECFTFPIEMFSRDEEDLFTARMIARQGSSRSAGSASRPLAKVAGLKGVPGVVSGSAKVQLPCIAHLVHSLGITKLAGRVITACTLGSSCKYEHVGLPLVGVKRTRVVDFVKQSKNFLLRAPTEKNAVLARI